MRAESGLNLRPPGSLRGASYTHSDPSARGHWGWGKEIALGYTLSGRRNSGEWRRRRSALQLATRAAERGVATQVRRRGLGYQERDGSSGQRWIGVLGVPRAELCLQLLHRGLQAPGATPFLSSSCHLRRLGGDVLLPLGTGASDCQLRDFRDNRRHHEALDCLTPTDVYAGWGEEMQSRREEIKSQTMRERRRNDSQMVYNSL